MFTSLKRIVITKDDHTSATAMKLVGTPETSSGNA